MGSRANLDLVAMKELSVPAGNRKTNANLQPVTILTELLCTVGEGSYDITYVLFMLIL
jgi:hypothetical protein